MTIQTQINFGGFYNSYHDDLCQQAVGYSLGADDPETGEIIYNTDMENFNEWQSVFVEYSKEYINKLNDELNISLKFDSLDSPKFYNFSTDVILASISIKDILKLFTYIKENDLKEKVYDLIKQKTTSVSGYSAFYSYCDFFKSENRYFLIECLIDVILETLNEDYPFSVEEFYI
jgi:hypothetical protein